MEQKIGETNKKYYGSALFWWLTVSIVAVLVVGAGVFTIITKFQFHHHSHSTQPTNVVHKYASALQLALQFFDVQKGILFESKPNIGNMNGVYTISNLIKCF